MTTLELKKKYGNIPVYIAWKNVPEDFVTKAEAKRRGYIIANETRYDAIKNSSGIGKKDVYYYLYDIKKLTPTDKQ